VLGINVHGKHLHRFDEALPHFSAPDVDYLWLQRRDKLRQAVSLSVARQTGQWSSLFRAWGEATYDRGLMQRALRSIHAEEDLISAYLHARGIACETIYYEDVVRDPESALRSALGVAVSETIRNGIALRPQGGSRNDAWVSMLGSQMFFGRDACKKSVRPEPAVAREEPRGQPIRVPAGTSHRSARRVLIVSPVPTHPATRGNRARVGSLARSLRSLGHDVHFLHVDKEHPEIDAMRGVWGSRYHPVATHGAGNRRSAFARRIGRRAGVDAAYRYGLDEWYDPAIDEAIDELHARIRFDTVVVEYVFLSRAFLRFGDGVLKVLDTHDVFANRHRHYLNNRQRPKWYSCTPRAEARGLDRSDVVLAIQEAEAEHFRSLTTREVVTIGHTVPLNPLVDDRSVPGRIVAIGSDNSINTRSLGWFIEDVLPRIRRELPHSELGIAGTVCSTLGKAPGVRLLGRFDDLGTAYASGKVAINPTLFGTGLKIKTIEALGHGRALVTTPCGAAGLADGAQSAFIVESDPEAFARRAVDLLVDEDRARALGEQAYRFAEQYNRDTRAELAALFGGIRAAGSEGAERVVGFS
jgi:glycosyltransferase involved in cell wall biosynthesis